MDITPPVLYLVPQTMDPEKVLAFFGVTPISVAVSTNAYATTLAWRLSNRVLIDFQPQSVLIDRYLRIANETEDFPIAIVGDFPEPIQAVEETNGPNTPEIDAQ